MLFVDRFGTVDSLASMPSIVTLKARSREPLTLMVPDPAPAERCTTPGSSVISESGLRPLSGSASIAFCWTTLPRVALVVCSRSNAALDVDDLARLPDFERHVRDDGVST